MYLTRMYVNPRRRQMIRMARDPQVMHAAVQSAFPPSANPGRTLWRLDEGQTRSSLLILSDSVPSLEHLQEQIGWETERTWATRDYQPLLQRLTKGQHYAFRLAANPTHVVTDNDGKKRRKAHVSVMHQAAWLTSRAGQMGIRFLETVPGDLESAVPDVMNRQTLRFRRRDNQITLARVTYQGAIEVVNASALRAVLTRGIGRGKAYGCGLMTLAPIRHQTP